VPNSNFRLTKFLLHLFKKPFCRLLFFYCFLNVGAGYTQEYSLLNQYTLGDGLPSRQVLDIAIDETGYIWLATPNGISRFDGYEFLNFDSTNTQGLEDHRILSLAISGSMLWVGTYTHIYSFDLRSYTASKFLPSKGEVRDLFSDKLGRIWFTDANGNVQFIENSEVINVQPHYNEDWTKSGINQVTSFGEDDRGVWWGRLDGSIHYYQTGRGLLELYVDGKVLKKRGTPVPLSGSEAALFSNEMAYIINNDSGSTGSQVLSNELQGRGKMSHFVSDELLLHVDGRNNVFEISTGTKNVDPVPELTAAISNGSGINAVMISDNLWWFASNDGLIKVRRRPDLFKKILTGKSASIRSIQHFGENQTLVSAYNGLFYLNEQFEVESHNNYPYKVFHQFFQNAEGGFLAVEENRGLMIIDSVLETFENLSTKDDNLSYQSFIRHGSDIYLGTFMGLYRIHHESDSIIAVSDNETGKDIGGVSVHDLHIRKDQLWIATARGLYLYDLETERFIPLDAFNSLGVRDIYETDDNALWLGTQENGLIQFDPETRSSQVFDHKKGLANNTVNIIASSDDDNVIWVGTNNGLTAVNRATTILTNYYKEDGLAHNEFNRKAVAYDLDGKIWMGGLDGITVFDPKKFTTKKVDVPKLILSGAGKYDGEEGKVIFSPTSPISSLVYHYGANDRLFRFRFGLNDFENPQNNIFRYKIEGLNKEWVDLRQQRELLIDNLSPGHYTLLISGTNGKGFWSDPLVVELNVAYAYYQRIWFYLIISIVLVMMGVVIHKVRVNQLLKIERMRAGIARDLHDELGSTLTRISMFSDLSSDGRHSSDVAKMSREASSTLSDIVWSIDNTDDTVGSLVDRIQDHLYKMVQVTDFESRFTSNGVNQNAQLKAAVKQNLFLIAKEAINNSVKYSNGSLISVAFSIEDQYIRLMVQDDGTSSVGQITSLRENGNGLRNMKTRAHNIGGTIDISNSKGFSITVVIPF
jgi:ligand-binding sensor domain-containing protein/two-component sensor histidine kinase